MLNVETLRKKFEEKNYFPQQDCEYVVKIVKALGFEASEAKNKPYPTYILNVEVLDILTSWGGQPNTITQKGDVNLLGFKLSDQKRFNDLNMLCEAAGVEFNNQIFDTEIYGIKGSLYGKILKLKISMNQNWANIKWYKLTERELSQYYPEPTITTSTDIKGFWEDQ